MTKEEFKELFLKLTEYTIPFGKEETLQTLLPKGWKKDSIGNYYYKVGKSETLFTTHLDTYSDKYERVNHVISKDDSYKISTDGTTILGGDNKLGCSILISMIKEGIPGTYYFFIGEEPVLSGGLYGSKGALKTNPEFFKKFKRSIAFDRRGYGSIVTRQMARRCCSDEFATEISKGLESVGINWDLDSNFGYYTDTAVFMDVIPECTNLSAGGFKEHFKEEWVDLNYTWKVFEFAKSFDWESLPVVREIEERFKSDPKIRISKYFNFLSKNKLDEIESIMNELEIPKTRDFFDGRERKITFSKWLEDLDFNIVIRSNDIYYNDNNVSLSELKGEIIKVFSDDVIDYIKFSDKSNPFKIFGMSKSQVIKLIQSVQ